MQNNFDHQLQVFNDRIENELFEGRLNFPTVLDVSMRVKRAADDPQTTLEGIGNVVRAEPVLSAKTVRMANAVMSNPYGTPITNVHDAVRRIGLASLRCLAFAVAAEQLERDFRSSTMKLLANGLWMHSIDVACWSHVIARKTHAAAPDTALFAGMLNNIGEFFVVARATEFPAMEQDTQRFAELVNTWSEPIGRTILEVFNLPGQILDAFNYENPYGGSWPPASLSDVLFIAGLVSETSSPFDALLNNERPSLAEVIVKSNIDEHELNEMLLTARDSRTELLAALSG